MPSRPLDSVVWKTKLDPGHTFEHVPLTTERAEKHRYQPTIHFNDADNPGKFITKHEDYHVIYPNDSPTDQQASPATLKGFRRIPHVDIQHSHQDKVPLAQSTPPEDTFSRQPWWLKVAEGIAVSREVVSGYNSIRRTGQGYQPVPSMELINMAQPFEHI